MPYTDIREESLKLKIAQDYFSDFDTTKIFGNIDFCVAVKHPKDTIFGDDTDDWHSSILWAEAKIGNQNIHNSLTQLVLTIGKARTFDKVLPPPFLAVFDSEKIALIQWSAIHDIFYTNDFNWNVTPSNHETREFKLLLEKIGHVLKNDYLIFEFQTDGKELKKFIKTNFKQNIENPSKVKITKNNFMIIYNKWLKMVKPTININWEHAKANQIIDGDFYLADILSIENKSIKEKLFVLLQNDHYELDRIIDSSGLFSAKTATFNDKQKAHNLFYNKYERPPKEEYWEYIMARRDLLVPQDVRERKGSFFTPQIWVELSQSYLADALGESWQDEYSIWDCASGTGNLLNGLTNKYNIWASTLDTQDVDVIKDRIKNGANLLESHVFQFDFLNDDFSKLPKELKRIIDDPQKRKKLVIYINPPYAEHGNVHAKSETGFAKTGVAKITKTHERFVKTVGTATRELFVQFFLRIYNDIPDCKMATFSKMKHINSQNFIKFRKTFKAECLTGFVMQGDTFDNVKGKFPIGFLIWDLSLKKELAKVTTDTFTSKGICMGEKSFYALSGGFISSWLRVYYDKSDSIVLGHIILPGVDMQCQNGVYFTSSPTDSDINQHKTATVTENNFKEMCVYLAVRHCIEATWVNDRDQFLYPNDGWKEDVAFQNDCLIFSLFHSQNRISSKHGTNHFIPFSEQQVNAQEKFESTFMSDFIWGAIKANTSRHLFDTPVDKATDSLVFSHESKKVYDAGLALWTYYHAQEKVEVNASLYDIREHFQGRNATGKMNSKSNDERYSTLIKELRDKLKGLATKCENGVYKYGFLLK